MQFHELLTALDGTGGIVQYILVALVSYVAYTSLRLRVSIRDELLKVIEANKRDMLLLVKEHQEESSDNLTKHRGNMDCRLDKIHLDYTPSAVLAEQFTRVAEQYAHTNLLLSSVGSEVHELKRDIGGLETRLTRIETKIESMNRSIN